MGGKMQLKLKIGSKFAKKVAELWPNLKIILAELAVIFKKFGRILFQTVGNTGKLAMSSRPWLRIFRIEKERRIENNHHSESDGEKLKTLEQDR